MISVPSRSADSVQVAALKEAIREYEANKWKTIGQKVGKPPKVSVIKMMTVLNCANTKRRASSSPKTISEGCDQGTGMRRDLE